MPKKQVVKEIHRDARKNFRRRKTIVRGINDTIQADLIEMIPYSKENKNMKYILVVINIFSKMAYARALKTKTGVEVANAMKSILNEIEIPIQKLHLDNGKEFYNQHMKSLLDERGIHQYSTYTTMKAAIVERFNRTLKWMLWMEFSLSGSYKWINKLEDIIKKYNNTKHRTIKMRPVDVNKSNEMNLLNTVYNYKIHLPFKNKNKFRVGDSVRISKYKHIFEKNYTAKWTCEIFKVKKFLSTDPVTYLLEDFNGDDIAGCFYEEEMQMVKNPDVFLIEKIVRRKNNKVFVKWLGFDEKYNSWIHKNDVI